MNQNKHVRQTSVLFSMSEIWWIAFQAKKRGAVDHGSYLVESGSADILFPTDFDLIAELYQKQAGQPSEKYPSSAVASGGTWKWHFCLIYR